MEAPHGAAAAPTAEDEHSSAGLLTRILHWATGSRWRLMATGFAGLTLLAGFVAAYSLFQQWAEEVVDRDYAQMALKAIDEHRFSDAKSLVGQMQQKPAGPKQLSAALYTLGVVKAHDAEAESSVSRRRVMHEVATRYFKKALKLDLEESRQGRAHFLLGKSLVGCGRSREAIQVLEESLSDPTQPRREIYSMLVAALLSGSKANYAQAIKYNDQLLAETTLSEEEKQHATNISAHILIRLDRSDEAQALLENLKASGVGEADRLLTLGRIDLEDAEKLPEGSPERVALLQRGRGQLQQVAGFDPTQGRPTHEAALWLAKALELQGDRQEAAAEYRRVATDYRDTPCGLTAALATADYLRRDGNMERALAQYQVVLRAIESQEHYDDSLMSLHELRDRMSAAFEQCLQLEMYPESLTLVDLFEPVFGDASTMELRAKAYEQWGRRKLLQEEGDQFHLEEQRREGRLHLREAGQAYEKLARLRFSSRQFVDDLWAAAESFFAGQSYTHAARLYDEYLHHESRRRNPLALLRRGQAELAARRYEQAKSALEECIEMYPRDPVAYQARLECARAYELAEKPAEAESLLELNLSGDVLTPASPEWRDSLFALGELLFKQARYDEAIARLDEAVKRYPKAPESLLARYTIARAHHGAAAEPAQRLALSKTENERQNAKTQMTERLIKAHEYYQGVQRTLTLDGGDASDPLQQSLLRNCYLLQGSVLFELRRYEEALKAYGNVITSYQSDPIAMESFVKVASCWRRLDQPVKARVTLDQAKLVLKEMPQDTDFRTATNFTREQWEFVLNQMGQW